MEGRAGARRVVIAGVLVVSVALTAFSIGTLIWAAFRGYDITDEGFFIYASDPTNKSNTANGLWGMYVGLLYRAVGYSVVGFRIVGVVLLVAAAMWFATRANLLIAAVSRRRLTRAEQLALVVATVAASLLYYNRYVLAPSYNWLALVGVFLALGGLFGVLAGRVTGPSAVGHAAAISAGGFLAFWGRPGEGAGLWLIAQVLILVLADAERAARIRIVLAGVATLLVLGVLHSLFLLGPSDTWDALQRARSFNFSGNFSKSVYAMFSDAAHETIGAPHRVIEVAGALVLLGLVPLLGLVLPTARRGHAIAVLSAGAVAVSGVVLSSTNQLGGGPGPFKTVAPATLALLTISCLAWASAAFVRRRSKSPGDALERVARRRIVLVVVVLLVAAGLFALTSNNPFLDQVSHVAVLGFIATAFVLIAACGPRHVLAAVLGVTVAAAAAAFALAVTGPGAPFRDAPLAQANTSVVVNQHGSRVLLAPQQAAFFKALVGPAQAAGFTKGTPLIDLTPFSPGVADALGAVAPSTLLFGYYDFSARWSLERQDRARWRHAWILVRVTGYGLLHPERVVSVLGKSFPSDYTLVATATWPFLHQVDQLWRPRA